MSVGLRNRQIDLIRGVATDALLARCRRSWPISETAALSGTVRFRTVFGTLSEN